jgi:glycosyltransferase involved in cell wall biosynthesis
MSMAEPRIWFDVEDLFHFAQGGGRPTGIQRVCFEIYAALAADAAIRDRIGFLRHGGDESGFVEADWEALQQILQRATLPSPVADPPPALPAPEAVPEAASEPAAVLPRRSLPRRALRRAFNMVPPRVSRPALLFGVMQAQAAAALAGAAVHAAAAGARKTARSARHLAMIPQAAVAPELPAPEPAAAPKPLTALARRGDVLAVLGSPWFEAEYAERAAYARGRLGMRLAVLMHDAIPVRRPEWTNRGMVRAYRGWYSSVLPLADQLFANSRSTAEDAERWCRRENIALRQAPVVLPFGTGFATPSAAADVPLPEALRDALGGRPFVLFVSTIEARKNHLLLFRVWRRLLEEMPEGSVPDLVFAGSVGWLVADLMQQIENSDRLGGRLHVLQGLDDLSLRALYRDCLFTVLPSFHEGWGLPVGESFAAGKPCVASNTTALPEAGGTLARYFDPYDVNDAARVIRKAIEDRPGLQAWEERVRREFRPVPWSRTAAALVEALDALR